MRPLGFIPVFLLFFPIRMHLVLFRVGFSGAGNRKGWIGFLYGHFCILLMLSVVSRQAPLEEEHDMHDIIHIIYTMYFLLLSFIEVKDPQLKTICRQRFCSERQEQQRLNGRRTKLVNLKSLWKQGQNVGANENPIHVANSMLRMLVLSHLCLQQHLSKRQTNKPNP